MIWLTEAIEDVKKYYPNIPDKMFMRLIALDPDYRDGSEKLGKAGKWILNLYNKGNLSEDEFQAVTDALTLLKTYRNRLANKDLGHYKSLEELEAAIAAVVDDDSMLSKSQKVRFLKDVKAGRKKVSKEDDYVVVLDTPNYVVYVPNTHEASMKLGKGTAWCTAHENPMHFEKYTVNGGKLYIVASKSSDERWQYSDKTGDFLDMHDDSFDSLELLRSDNKLSKFFSKLIGVDIFDFDGHYVYTGKCFPDFLAFQIKSITIPDGVTSINDNAFIECENLTSITIPDSVTSIGGCAFYHCESLTSIEIPDSVKSIGDAAFYGCKNLTSITIPDGVKSISHSAFSGCTSLKSITIPDSITSIENYAFHDCINLTSIVIPDSVTGIGGQAFANCINLQSITISDSVKSIGDNAFYCCSEVVVYTNNKYVIDYCKENDISVKKLNKQTESLRLYIREK